MTAVVALDDLITAVTEATSPAALVEAVTALAQVSDRAAIPALITVLGYNNPGAAQIAVQRLIAWGRPAVPELLARLDDYNYGARAYGIRVLAAIGDGAALDVLLQAALRDFAPSVRRAALRGLGNLDWPAGRLERQSEVLAALEQGLMDGDWSIRYASVVALEHWGCRASRPADLPAHLLPSLAHCATEDGDSVVQTRAQLALTRLTPPAAFEPCHS
ncbi:MAG: HEAT repeat domain-containing protein [Gloeomargaritaceae cyanobacterium C42_A2020_066]|nr:HEAT repeat domain-containing protein [Gloeomargaritaceae cyanobacterium C42_A2020_066]